MILPHSFCFMHAAWTGIFLFDLLMIDTAFHVNMRRENMRHWYDKPLTINGENEFPNRVSARFVVLSFKISSERFFLNICLKRVSFHSYWLKRKNIFQRYVIFPVREFYLEYYEMHSYLLFSEILLRNKWNWVSKRYWYIGGEMPRDHRATRDRVAQTQCSTTRDRVAQRLNVQPTELRKVPERRLTLSDKSPSVVCR